MHSGTVFVAGSILLIILFYRSWQRHKLVGFRKLPLPPGPKSLPIIGNLRDIPTYFPWVTYGEWAKQYGDVVHVEAFGNHIIVLDSLKATNDLFEDRSSAYSDKPRMPMVRELMDWDWNTAFMGYGSLWRQHRKIFHQHFRPAAIEAYQPSQTIETHKLLRRLLETPEEYRHHIRHLAAATIMRITYGIEIQDSDDPYIVVAEEAVDSLSQAAMPGAFLVDMMPILKYVPPWVPGAGFQRKARHWRNISRVFVEKPFNTVKTAVASGTAFPSLTATLLEEMTKSPNVAEEEELAMSTTAGSYAAAVDTTSTTLYTFLVAMLMYPEVQKRAQAELDAVVGRDRLPDFSDKSALPYIDAVVKETMRWWPAFPLGIAHSNIVDDEYNGYYIPKGAIVMGNVWSILHDEKMYPEPLEYRPERFLKDGKTNPGILKPDTVAFGFARRICPGRYLALNGIYLTIASILSTFDITPARDSSGNPEVLRPEWTSTLLSAPKPFRCTLTPRSDAPLGLIR